MAANQFEDLLGDAKFTTSTKKDEPKTIAAMRRKQLEEDMDPDKLKVSLLGIVWNSSDILMVCWKSQKMRFVRIRLSTNLAYFGMISPVFA